MTGEDIEALVGNNELQIVWNSENALIFLVASFKKPINPIINQTPVVTNKR
jgi:hypothetical protein